MNEIYGLMNQKPDRYTTDYALGTPIKFIYGWTAANHYPAIRIAEKLGWQKIGSISPSLKGNQEREHYMWVYAVPEI